jgi:hypothetical protein
MSSSQFGCHRGVIDDMELRISGRNRMRTNGMGAGDRVLIDQRVTSRDVSIPIEFKGWFCC